MKATSEPAAASLRRALAQATERLAEAGVSEPRLTAEVLLSWILGRDRSFLYAHPEQVLTARRTAAFEDAVVQRAAGKPVQYITGRQEFFGLEFRVTPAVLIPRPETEMLVEEVLARAAPAARILDAGTGSGCIAIALAKSLPKARLAACDISSEALALARGNAKRLQAAVDFVQADFATAFAEASFDVAVSNPPYIAWAERAGVERQVREFEPAGALFAGESGLEAYRALAADAARILRPGGWLALELGAGRREAVEALFAGPDWGKPDVRADLAGWDRTLVVQRQPSPGRIHDDQRH